MLTHAPKIPAWISAEIKHLAALTAAHNLEKLRAYRDNTKGPVNVDIYHHSEGTDSYFCDVRKRYLRWKDICDQADLKLACGQYLFTAVIEYKEGIHFVSSLTKPNPNLN